MCFYTYLNRRVIHHKNVLRFNVFVDNIFGVQHLKPLADCATNSPDFLLLYYTLICFSFLYQVAQQVALTSQLHYQVEIPVAVFILFEKAVIQLDKMRRWKFFEE